MSYKDQKLGCVIGAAIGDALGHPTEFNESPNINGYELFWEKDGKKFAPFTDDTQMSLIVLKNFLEARANDFDLDLSMSLLAQDFIMWKNHPKNGHRSPGDTCIRGCINLENGTHWSKAGIKKMGGGCGSVMRTYPSALVFEDLQIAERWAVSQSKLTHRSTIALAACASMTNMIHHIINNNPISLAIQEAVKKAEMYDPVTAKIIQEAVDETDTTKVLNKNRGWTAHECVADAIHIINFYPNDFKKAVLIAANSPGDSDSIATLVGALSGARLGISSIPKIWIDDLEDVEEIMELAKAV